VILLYNSAVSGNCDKQPYAAVSAWLGRVSSQPGQVSIDA